MDNISFIRMTEQAAQLESKILEIRAVCNLSEADANLLLELVQKEGEQSPYTTYQVMLHLLDQMYDLCCQGREQVVYTLIELHKATLEQTENGGAIIPYQPRKRFAVGDGSTRFTLPGERPLTGEEKYQKPLHEAMMDFEDAVNNTFFAVSQVFDPVIKSIEKLCDELMKIPDFGALVESMENDEEHLKAAARARSRADVRDKRKSMMKRRGRK